MSDVTKDQVVEYLSNLTMMEVKGLVEELEEMEDVENIFRAPQSVLKTSRGRDDLP